MGRIAAHTQEQVFEAANKLAANGQEVTATTLREVLGRGSFSTLGKHIDAWQQARKAAPAPVVIDMPESVKAAFAQCWQAAASEAGKEIAAIREKADAEIKTTKRRLDEALAEVERLEEEANADAARLETAEGALSAERTASHQAATDAAAREAALAATAEQMRQQIEAQQAELARVHAEAEAARNQHSAELSRLTADFSRQLGEHAAALAGVQAQLDQANAQVQAFTERVHALSGELMQARAEAQRLDELRRHAAEDAERAHQARTKAETERDEASARERAKIEEAATAKAEAARLADQLKDQKARSVEVIGKLEKSKQSLEADLSTTRKEAREAAAQLGRAQGELEALRTQVAGQNDTIRRLADQGDTKGKGGGQ